MVNVGIRPEDLLKTDGGDYALEGSVAIAEKLGEVTQVYFEKAAADRDAVIAKLPGIHNPTKGDRMRMTATPAKVHLFSNGKSLLYI